MLAFALAGCSALRLGYNNGPQLAWWWLDGYLDVESEQVPAFKAAIDRWFEWHRATQLPEYVALLSALRAQADGPIAAEEFCRWNTRLRIALDPAIDRALVAGAGLLPRLGEAQFRHLEQRYAKSIEDMRDEYLQPDPVLRQRRSVERALERIEQVYGRLGEAQREVVTEGVAASPFDPRAWMEERRARQRDTVQTLRRLAAAKAMPDARVAALRALAERSQRSPDPRYRAYQERLVDYNCAFAARIHASTTPAQRQKARETLQGWEEDLRSLYAAPENGPAKAGPAAALSPG